MTDGGHPEDGASESTDGSDEPFYPVYGTFKSPVEGAIVFLLADRLAGAAAATGRGESLGLLAAIILWVTVLLAGYAVLTVLTEPPARSVPPETETDTDPTLAVAGVVGGGLVLAVAWGPFLEHAGAWLVRILTGPGSGVPPDSSPATLGFWALAMFVGIEVFARGVDRLLTDRWRRRLERERR